MSDELFDENPGQWTLKEWIIMIGGIITLAFFLIISLALCTGSAYCFKG